jgi:hypothetical protein
VEKKKELSTLMSGVVGGMAAGIEISFSYPFEYLKTVMQLDKKY